MSGLVPGSFTVTAAGSLPPSGPKMSDVAITPDGAGGFIVQLRKDRLGDLYTLQATASSVAGNKATTTATCSVPMPAPPN